MGYFLTAGVDGSVFSSDWVAMDVGIEPEALSDGKLYFLSCEFEREDVAVMINFVFASNDNLNLFGFYVHS